MYFRLIIIFFIILSILLWVIMAPTSAYASPATRAALEQKAHDYWGELPTLELKHAHEVNDTALAWAMTDGPLWINIPRWRWLSWPEKCYTWLHERGHNLGLDHTETGLMSPKIPMFMTGTPCEGWHP